MLVRLLTVLLPSGGQLGSRRNAWAAMSEGAVRARARREATAALEQACAAAAARPLTAPGGGV